MNFIIIGLSAFIISSLTLFSGFGLGTVLTPIFAVFFPVPVAISLTAIVHFLNNIFKFILLGKMGDKEIVIKFGIPAIFGAMIGGIALSFAAHKSFIINYEIFQHIFRTELVNLIIGTIIICFILIELIPTTGKFSLGKKYLPYGGIISGFFGGLSGNQGAFRSIFLLKCNLSEEKFIATSAIIACLIDVTRFAVYGATFLRTEIVSNLPLLTVAVISALFGSFFSRKFMKKITIKTIRIIVSILLTIISLGLITGYI